MCAVPEKFMTTSLWNKKSSILLIPRLTIAESFTSRLVGLLGRSGLADDEALLLADCKQVHMFFMKFPIDVAFCTKDGEVVHVVHRLRPWRVSAFVKNCDFVVELRAGRLEELQIGPGVILEARSNSLPS